MHKKLLNRLPDNYNKKDGSNIGKLYQVLASEMGLIEKTFEDIKDSKDIDKASDRSLELIGKNVLEYRSTEDEWFRKFIKIKILANRSVGDIQTINTVASFLMGDSLIGIEETWQYPEFQDIAGLAATIKTGFKDMFKTPIVYNALDRTRAGGVKWHWVAKGSEENKLNIAVTNRGLRTNRYDPVTIEDFNVAQKMNVGIALKQVKFTLFDINIIEDFTMNNGLNVNTATRKVKKYALDSHRE